MTSHIVARAPVAVSSVVGLLLLVWALCLTVLLVQPAAAAEEEQVRKFSRGVVIHFEGAITPLLEQYLYRKLDTARKQKADVVILEIDSPGGFLDSSIRIAERLRDLDWAHTVAFVQREALSGAAIAALGCNEIVMTRLARLGDAGPIFRGDDALFRYAPEKIRSDLAGRVRDLAKAKDRPPAVAEAMVDMDLVVYHVKNKTTGDETIMSDAEIEASSNPNDWEKLKPVAESGRKRFLTVNGTEAVALRLAQALVRDGDELVRQHLKIANEPLVLRATNVDTAVTILNFPLVTGLLFVIGLVALYIEFSAPGLGMGGLIAGLCFALFFWSRFLGGTADWLEVILFLAGVAFLAVELFVIPGFGVAGLSGILLIIVSVVMASQGFVIPATPRQLAISQNAVVVLAVSGLTFLAAAVTLSRYFKVIPAVRWLVLEAPPTVASGPSGKERLSDSMGGTGFPVQVGDWGLAASPLRPAGKVRFGEHFVDVVSDGSFVDKGRRVQVVEISGNRVVVREMDHAE